MFTTWVTFEGFMLKDLGYTIKEMTLLYAGGEYDHFLFEAPKRDLSSGDQQTVNWTTRNLNGLNWDEGLLPYSSLQEILASIATCRIVCHGSSARMFLRKTLPNTVIVDTSLAGNKYPKSLTKLPCGRDHRARWCSLSKAHYIKEHFNIDK